ncbi:hypothetical protein SAMN02800694_1401 [Luteibacter sp. UNCMF331Sha3.1]|uniref:hypothetical protein n=1 Tax=Luteibacter sp. UNCMF331Sha3.1 TaxID=1502760 RepID=UPI0008B56D8C|nr:hypothetical protein [Luteibacter sp. UNCMF331Sha3.1]SEM52802.1 hypothetical protein SAMN02800694_1401 [Luteibacter sp. UNCMF331Sha3.1]
MPNVSGGRAFVRSTLALLALIVTTSATASPAVAATTGAEVAMRLQARFDETVTSCASNEPAVACSGLLIHQSGDAMSSVRRPWQLNPTTTKGGVHFAWLRTDTAFYTSFANGFVVFPALANPGYQQLIARCAYVLPTSWFNTDSCGTPCHVKGILTGMDWALAHVPPGERRCAFGIAGPKAAPDPAFAWMQMIEARKLWGSTLWNTIIVTPWAPGSEGDLPIEAFYYVVDGRPGTGLEDARQDQLDFMEDTGRWVPIVRWNVTPELVHLFTYEAADQAIATP